jgi:tRNA(Ile)-lysidine synthase
MKNLLTQFQESLQRLGITKKDRILIAVSGGLDSIVLAACAQMANCDFGIAHANFQLRSDESDRDERFVRELAIRYNKSFYLKKFNTAEYAEIKKCSIQVAARELRYQWFSLLMEDVSDPFGYVFTAHHLDDNIETMLMHFFRGTGLAGMRGMPEKNGRLLRPLLSVSRNTITGFAKEHGLEWVDDSSNATDDYTRNYFRNQLIPSLTPIFPEVHANLEKNLHRFSEAFTIYQEAVSAYKKKLLKPDGQEIHIPILLLKKVSPLQTVVHEIIREYGFSSAQSQELIRLMDSVNGKYITSFSHRIIKNRRWLIIAPIENKEQAHIVIEADDTRIDYPGGHLEIHNTNLSDSDLYSGDSFTASLDAGKIQYPLVLRHWKTGDYFYPLGMKKKKKLARFFIDQKLSKTAKEKVWVVVMDSQIVWVVGLRIDNRFCISPSTSGILFIKNENRQTIA